MTSWPLVSTVYLFISAFAASWIGVALFRRWTIRRGFLDIPNVRSSHSTPTPRGGGLIIVLVCLVCYWATAFLFQFEISWGYFLGALLVATVGWLDDIYSLGFTIRLLVHAAAASILISDVGSLQGKKIAIGPFESGTRALALQLLSVNGTVLPPTTLLPLSGKDAVDALQAGTIDAAFFVSPAESPMIEKLASDPNLNLLSFERADAYSRRFPYLTELLLPKGVFDFMANIPKENVKLLSPTANLIAQDTLHPALAYLLMRAATQIHGESGLLHKAGTFPAPLDANFPLSPEATRYYKTGAPFLQRYLPFWAANLVERLWVMLVPAIAIMVPLFRTIPPLYRWRVRSRIYRWYARLKEIELQLDEEPRPVPLTDMLERLDVIERSVNRIPTPLAYSENLYSFRQHIELVRARVRHAIELDTHETG